MSVRTSGKIIREMLVLYGLLLAFGLFWRPDDPLLHNIRPHPFWAIILLSAVRYGNPAGLIAGVLAALLSLCGLLFEGISFSQALHLEIKTFIPPALYILVGSMVGEAIQKHNNINSFLREQLDNEKRQLAESEMRRQELNTAYRKLEGRLAGESDSITQFFGYLRQIDATETEAIYANLLRVVRDALEVEVCSLWLRSEQEEYRQLGHPDAGVPLPLLGQIALREERVVTAREFFLDREVQDADGLLAGLLYGQDNRVDAVVVIQKIPFVRFTARTAMLFEILLDWTSQLLAHQRLVASMQERDILNQNLGLTSEAFFRTNTLKMCRQMQRHNVHSSLLFLHVDGIIAPPVRHRLNILMAAVLQQTLRLSDTAAYFPASASFAVFLPGTDAENAERVCQKLEEQLEAFSIHPYVDDPAPLVVRYEIRGISKECNLEHLLDNLLKKTEGCK